MRDLTERQRRVWEYVAECLREHAIAPTLEEIGRELGGVSPQVVRSSVLALEQKGYLRRDLHQPRSLRLAKWPGRQGGRPDVHELPVVGVIAAGQPIETLDPHGEQVWVEAGWARSPQSYVLRVRGHSMVGDGILDGDLVVVEPAEDAANGETVVALLADGSVTLKRLFREPGYVRLQPANPHMEPIVVPTVKIQGKVVAVLRRLGGEPSR